jgi:hypothetical protein
MRLKRNGLQLTTHRHLVTRLRMRKSNAPLLTQLKGVMLNYAQKECYVY